MRRSHSYIPRGKIHFGFAAFALFGSYVMFGQTFLDNTKEHMRILTSLTSFTGLKKDRKRQIHKRRLTLLSLESIIRITFTANGRNDHVTMFTQHLPLAVFSFLVNFSTLKSKATIILHYSNYVSIFSRKYKRESQVCRLP